MNAEQFRDIRKVLGLTQHGLADALRMGRWGFQTISKWESDRFEGEIPGPVQVALESLLRDKEQKL